MMKGDRKRHRFKKGNTFTCTKTFFTGSSTGDAEQQSSSGMCTWEPRMTKEEFYSTTKLTPNKMSRIACNADNIALDKKFLRPLHSENEDIFHTNDETTERRVVEKCLTIAMLNEVFNEHMKQSPRCHVVNFDVIKEVQWGWGWKWTLQCMNCKYESRQFKLFQELKQPPSKRGPKPAAINYGILSGKLHSTLGNKKFQLISASAGIPPMSYNGMRKAENKVCAIVEKVNETDMTDRLERLKKLQDPGKPVEVNLQMDGTYQSLTFGSRHKLGQSASQVAGVVCENMTDMQQVVSLPFENKHCWTGSWLRGRGYNVTCPGGHPGCTANISRTKPLGEKSLGYTVGKEMAEKNILVKNVTTDGDSASSVGLQAATHDFIGHNWTVRRLADPIHRGQSLFKQGLKAKFSAEMFPGANAKQRKELQKALMIDVKERAHGILKRLFEKYNGDLDQIFRRIVHIVDRVVDCYSGKCGDNCRWTVTLCGGGKFTSWWFKSAMLSSYNLTKGSFQMTEDDRQVLTDTLELKLSVAAIKEMPYNFNTNKCEAVNHAISASLPKNRNFSRNARARTCAAVLRVNNNMDVAVGKTLDAVGAPLHKKSVSASALKKMKKEDVSNKEMQKDPKVKGKKALARKIQATEYVESKRQCLESDYVKDHLEPKLPKRRKSTRKNEDHTYNKARPGTT